ncbi:MAG: hypothetical protein HRU46_06905 [Verrucomicrobiales bacterium]|nr:hypothetical protein [Verrucomicrobiales bacterium]
MNRLISSLFLAAVAAVMLSGCAGYELGDVKPSVYAGINNLHVPIFKNDTLEPRLSSLVTNAVTKEIQADGTYRISNRRNSDAVLVGKITQIRKTQLRAARTDTLESQELRMQLYVEFHLEDPNTGEIIRSTIPEAEGSKDKRVENDPAILAPQGRVIGTTIQFVDPSFQVGERNALSVAAQDAASKLVGQLANGW